MGMRLVFFLVQFEDGLVNHELGLGRDAVRRKEPGQIGDDLFNGPKDKPGTSDSLATSSD
jgi:hypothetical protein